MSKPRKIRSDATVGTVEKKLNLEPGTIRNPDGTNARSNKKMGTLRQEYGDKYAGPPVRTHVSTLTNRHGKAALAAQLQPDLFARIQQVLTDHPGLLWMGSSEEDQSIAAYQGRLSELAGWGKVGTKYVLEMCGVACENPDLEKLMRLFLNGQSLVAYKRPAPGQASTFDLVVGVVEGDVLTGIATKTVET